MSISVPGGPCWNNWVEMLHIHIKGRNLYCRWRFYIRCTGGSIVFGSQTPVNHIITSIISSLILCVQYLLNNKVLYLQCICINYRIDIWYTDLWTCHLAPFLWPENVAALYYHLFNCQILTNYCIPLVIHDINPQWQLQIVFCKPYSAKIVIPPGIQCYWIYQYQLERKLWDVNAKHWFL